jgi:hypothetical protein
MSTDRAADLSAQLDRLGWQIDVRVAKHCKPPPPPEALPQKGEDEDWELIPVFMHAWPVVGCALVCALIVSIARLLDRWFGRRRSEGSGQSGPGRGGARNVAS